MRRGMSSQKSGAGSQKSDRKSSRRQGGGRSGDATRIRQNKRHPHAAAGGCVFHYTDADAYKAIVSQAVWLFRAAQPPGDRSFGAYFTLLLPDDNKLAAGTRLPRVKRQYVFAFDGAEGLRPVPGGRAAIISGRTGI